MITVSVTRFRLRSGNPVSLMLFFWHTLRSARQAERTPGFLGDKLFNDANHTYWTVTLWESEEAMRTFRSGGEYQRAMRAMKLLDRFCSEAAVVSYQAPSPELPNAETRRCTKNSFDKGASTSSLTRRPRTSAGRCQDHALEAVDC